jgi:hypothetical protein
MHMCVFWLACRYPTPEELYNVSVYGSVQNNGDWWSALLASE